MFSLKVFAGIAMLIWYIYSSVNNKDTQKKKKSSANPTPEQKGKLEELMDRMIEEQKKKIKEAQKTTPIQANIPRKMATQNPRPISAKQDLPFEKRKSSEPKEMPSRKQIEKVQIREKKATEPVKIKVKDYDENIVNHDKPHPVHHLSDDSKIKFHFKEEEIQYVEFDARQAIIYQTIFERKEY